jgi:2,4-dienoyl-CoA reductase (NADPH2)
MPAELDWSRDGAGAFAPLSEALKKIVSIPVIAVGRLSPELGESLLEQGKTDFIAMNRRLLADPELPLKVASGRLDDIAPCTACLYCWSRRRRNLTIQCRINSRLGRERELSISPVRKPKKVLVVGSGPSGMEAARISAMRGHLVSIVEKEKRIGGLLPLAAMVKGHRIEDITSVISYFQKQLVSLGVTIEMGKEADPKSILAYHPDAVILATGGKPAVPEIPGINVKKVLLMAGLHKKLKFFLKIFSSAQLNRLSKIWMPVGKNVAIIGSDIQALELAEFLVKRGRNIAIIDKEKMPGQTMVPEETRTSLVSWLERKGTEFYMSAEIKAITAEGLSFLTEQGETKIIAPDTIIPALPLHPDPVLFESLNSTVMELYRVGDCLEPGLISDAVGGGADIGYRL